MPDLSRAVDGKLEIDSDGDGVTEVLYTASSDGKRWINKTVYAHGCVGERFGNYDEASGMWKTKDVDSDWDTRFDRRFADVDLTDEDWEEYMTFDGTATHLVRAQCLAKYVDTDNNGLYDKKLIESDPENTHRIWEAKYTDFNKEHKRWGEFNIANPTNLFWQTAYLDSNMTNDMWEAKWVDLDSDGRWDVRWVDENAKDWDWEALYSKPLVRDGKWIWREGLQDTTGNGKWDKRFQDFDGDGSWEVMYRDKSGDGKWNEKATKKNGEFWEEILIDDDGDGTWDRKKTNESRDANWDTEYLYDKTTRKWVKKGT